MTEDTSPAPPPAPLELRLPDPSLVVLVGAAGAGKTTFAARHFAPVEVLSSDAYRGLVSGDETDQRATGAAFAALHRDVARRLAAGHLAVVDATNVQAHARRALLARAAAAGVPAVAIVLDLPAALVLSRNRARRGGAAVPEVAVRRQLGDLAAALGDSPDAALPGFDAVHRLRSPADVDRVTIVRIPARATRRGASTIAEDRR